MDIPLLLGPVAFAGFEIPERIGFGGRQRMAVHRLPGGARVIDTLGPDDADVVWSGVFSGAEAMARARELDALRCAGLPLPLTWDGFFALVVIAQFSAEYRNPSWVPYRISCTVLENPLTTIAAMAGDLVGSVLGDLVSADGYGLQTGPLQSALGADGAMVPGSGAYRSSASMMGGAYAAQGMQLSADDVALGSADYPDAVDLAGSVAQGTAARGYLGRALFSLLGSGI